MCACVKNRYYKTYCYNFFKDVYVSFSSSLKNIFENVIKRHVPKVKIIYVC